MVAAGVTTTEVPVKLPGIQVYVVAPLAVSVVELPLQIVGDDAEAVTVGLGVTVINCVAVPVHPAVVQVTV